MASSARIDELRKKFEENPRRYFAPLANEYRKAGDIEQAIGICREYLPQQPGHMSGHIVYGQALYEARQYEEARTVFETALALDPENLIALRHLGDIALIVGDIESARTWYGRVLEADPRNEEIQAQLKSLDTIAAPVASTPTPLSAPTVEATPLSVPTVVTNAMHAPAVERTVELPVTSIPAPHPSPDAPNAPESLSSTPTTEVTIDKAPVPELPDLEKLTADGASTVDLPVEKAAGFETTAMPTSDAPPTPGAGKVDIETTATSGEEARAIDSFTLDGLQTTSMAPAPEAVAPEEPPPVGAGTQPAPAEVEDLQLLPAPEATPEARPEATPPTPSTAAPPSDVRTTPEFPPSESAPVAEASAPGASSDLPFLDLGESTPAPPPTSAPSSAPPATQTPAKEPAMAESKPFVTETMAELYEQQGHRDEALRVYRALQQQRPDDEHIRSRIGQLEGRGGPTIRDVLARVAARRKAAASTATAAPAPQVEAFGSADVPEVSQAQHAASSQTRPDELGQLFGSPNVSGADENAAVTLSAAFSTDGRDNGSGSTGRGLPGSPARPASKDLSLDTVFGSEPPSVPPASSFSFDQFFSERATAEHPTAGRQGGTEGEETKDDVAKFTQWLEGLKQR